MLHITNKEKLPLITLRIKDIIEKECKGNVSEFARQLGLTNSSKINRLFTIDKRNNQYPNPSSDIITLITNRFNSYSADWILRGDADTHVNNISISKVNGSENIVNSKNVLNSKTENEYIEIIKKQQEQIDALLKIVMSDK